MSDDDAPKPEQELDQVLAFEEEVKADVRKRDSLYDQVRALPRPQKVILALRCGMEARLVLLKSYDPMIYFYLCKNPKITAEEIVEIAKSDLLTPNTVELIARNKDWMTNERVKFNIVMNRKTPRAVALHVFGLLNIRSLKQIAKTPGSPPAFRRLALNKLQGLPAE
ncbi:MAG: hypothetical protein HY234_07130 [Acidobacteria bacterium]|nr:hypothetical protein [Acidobacteriota bacterium]